MGSPFKTHYHKGKCVGIQIQLHVKSELVSPPYLSSIHHELSYRVTLPIMRSLSPLTLQKVMEKDCSTQVYICVCNSKTPLLVIACFSVVFGVNSTIITLVVY